MTTTPLQFQLDNERSTVRLFGLTEAITANALASNINFVQWDGVTGIGQIIYNDRMPLPEQFTDPSPYQTYVNQWMSAAALPSAFPLTLAQAQAIKSSLVDSIWSGKRQAPVSVVTSLGTYSFDANDVLSGDLNASAWMAAVAALISQINTTNTDITSVVSTIKSQVNADVANLASQINSYTGGTASTLNSYTGTLASQLNGNWLYLNGAGLSVTYPTQGVTSLAGSAVANNIPITASYSGPTALTALTAPVDMLPIGSTTYPAFILADLFAVVTAVQNQRNNEAAARAVNQAAIAALTTVAACISFDATAGW